MFPVTLGHTMAIYSGLWMLADYTEQKVISKKEKMDLAKTVRMVTVGTFVIAPIVCTWIAVAERLFPGRSTRTVVKKILVDQLSVAPFAISCFYISTSILEGRNREGIYAEWRQKFPKTYARGLMLWPAVHFINFKYVPYPHRPKLIGSVSFLWSIFLCYLKEEPVHIPEKNAANQSSSS